jgi:hypothetical protein
MDKREVLLKMQQAPTPALLVLAAPGRLAAPAGRA